MREPRVRGGLDPGAVWSLLLPRAERVLCLASEPPPLVRALARRGSRVDVVTRLPHERWMEFANGEARLRALWEPDTTVEYDLAVLWDPPRDAALREWLRLLAALPLLPRGLALWTRNPLRDRAPWWPVADARLARAGWRPGARVLALPDAERIRQLVRWEDWTRTPLVRHHRSHRAWKAALVRLPAWRWTLPARLRRASLGGLASAPSALEDLLTVAASCLGGRPRLAQLLVSPNGVAIASVRATSAVAPVDAILKIPYATHAEARVAANANALEWLAGRAGALGRWSAAMPRLLGRGTAGGWTFTAEEHAPGTQAQGWDEAAAFDAMRHLADLLLVLARLGQPARPLEPTVQERTCLAPARRAAALLDRMAAARLEAFAARLRTELVDVAVPLVPRHGDFKLENVLGRAYVADSLRVLDWELWSPRGLPLLDAWHLVLSRRARALGCSMGDAVRRWTAPGSLAGAEQEVLQRVGAGLDPRYVELAPALYWLDRIGPVAARGAWPRPGWERSNVIEVLDFFAARAAGAQPATAAGGGRG